MEPIFPLNEERINQFCGMPVCIVTTDGQRHVGILSGCNNGSVMLNSGSGGPGQSHGSHFSSGGAITHLQAKGKSKKGKYSKTKKSAASVSPLPASNTVQTQAWGFNPFFGSSLAIDLALIAFLFLLI